MLGFQAQDDVSFQGSMSEREVNDYLHAYSAVHLQCDAWVVLVADNIDNVFSWRLQAEQAMRTERGTGLTDDEVHDFVSRFMPAYERYLPVLCACGPERRHGCPTIKVSPPVCSATASAADQWSAAAGDCERQQRSRQHRTHGLV